jgi:hypothetical protein
VVRGRALGHVGRDGRRGHRAEGADRALPPWHPLAGVAQLKPKLTLEVVVTGGSAERVRWGEAALLSFRYTHPRSGADVEIRQAVRAPRDDLPFDLTIGARLALVCWGVMPSGMLRHPGLGGA